MGIDPSRAIGGYAAVMTLAAVWLALGAAADGGRAAAFGTIDVERINVREPDGTLRLAIASAARMPGLIVQGREYRHPTRREAGMIFYNDEGTENGGLVFDGGMKDGRPTSSGSLTFDRWRQDQTVQLTTSEDGGRRRAGIAVVDRPDTPLDPAAVERIGRMDDGPARDAAVAALGRGVAPRAFLGRQEDGAATLALRDGAGRERLRLKVAADGTAGIEFLDARGRVTRTVR